MTHFVLLLTLCFPILIATPIFALSARSSRGIVFGVTLPLEVADSSKSRAAIARYRLSIFLVGLVSLFITAALALHGDRKTASTFEGAALFFLLALALVLRAYEAKRLRSAAITAPRTRVAELAIPSATAALTLTAAPLLLFVAVGFWLKAHWLQIPANWPQHWDAAGNVNGWGTRSFASVFLPLFMGAGLTLLFLLINTFNTKAPGPQAVQRARFAAPMAAISWVLALSCCTLSLIPLYQPGLTTVLVVIAANVIALLGLVVWSIVRSGFLRKDARAWNDQPYDGTADHNWKAGIFYINRADPAVLVPKRFGYGWTLNFGRPIAWIFMGGALLLAFTPTLAPLLFHHH